MPHDRSLNLSIYVVGQQFPNGEFEAVVAYIQRASTPSTPGLVDSFRTGNIDFTRLERDPDFSMNVDITFGLVPSIFALNGQPVRACWATPITRGIAITPSSPEMRASYVGDEYFPMGILLDDNDDDGNQYTYKLGVMLPDFNNYFIGLDPVIVNKPGGK